MQYARPQLEPPAVPLVQHDHDVQFYEQENFLYDAAGQYILTGLQAGEPVIVIATAEHRRGFLDWLAEAGLDVDSATAEGLIAVRDARELLDTFMDVGIPDPGRFKTNIVELIEKARAGREHLPLRAFGEMVDILWRDGNPDGAIRLEELWNGLAAEQSFSLFCAYSMTNFAGVSSTRQFQEVCAQHRHALASDGFSNNTDDDSRSHEINYLQHRSRALESEIEQRKRLEKVLRQALAARQEADTQLRQSQQELEDFFENAAECLHWVDGEGIILWANQAELDMMGYLRGEYVGRHVAEFEADPGAIGDLFRRLKRNESVKNYEARLRRKDGSVRHVLINSNVLWRNNEFIHTRCFTRDITDRKHIESERDRLLASEQTARREAEAANRLRDQFLATVSHELRTPLATIVGWTGIAKRSLDDSEMVTRALEVIGRNGNLQLKLVEDLLDVSRMLTGKMTINREPVELVSVLMGVVESVRPDAVAKTIDVRVHIDPADYVLTGDAVRLQQVIGNLLTNAVKFTPDKGWIKLALRRSKSQAEITIVDSGQGISPEFLPYVFERFSQADSSLSREHDGLGLGLAIVRCLVEAHGGAVQAHSAGPGCGATFIVTLPLVSRVQVDYTER